MWVWKVKVISWPWPKDMNIQKFKLDFLRNYSADLNQIFMKAFRYKEMKIWWHDAGHMTKMAATPIYSKKPFKNLLRNRQTISTKQYVTSGTPAHHSLFKWWPSINLDLFYGKVIFGNLGFSMEKSENSVFLQKLLQPVTWKLAGAVILLNIWRFVNIEGQGHFLTLAQGHVHTKNQTGCSQKQLCQSEPNFLWKLSGIRKENLRTWCWSHDQDSRHAQIW